MITAMTLNMVGCTDNKSTEPDNVIIDPVTGEEIHSYNIAVCLSEDNTRSSAYVAGFKAALNKRFPDDIINYQQFVSGQDSNTPRDIAISASSGYNVVFTCGEEMLDATQQVIKIVPIVACDVYDFQGITGLEMTTDWDKYTGRNITGVSNIPPYGPQLSIMIEASNQLFTVGLLQAEDDHNADFQNQMFIKKLKEANIKYYLYTLPPKDYDEESVNLEGDTVITHVNREALIKAACQKCDVLYIPGGSSLGSDKEIMQMIRNQSVMTCTPTYGGDTRLAEYTTVTLFSDPYDLGYQAGKKAASILKGSSAKDIKISNCSEKYCTKLYNGPIARASFIEFPKSFAELNTFLKDYSFEELTVEDTEEAESDADNTEEQEN